jgi:2-dehydropantoate 2-reductase
MQRLSIAVLGPGGVGGLLAALFARAGHRVVCLTGERTADVLRRDGITVRSGQFGDFAAPVEADTELRTPVDLCFVTVKATAMPQALDRVPADALGDALVVPLLNGLDHMGVLRERYPAEQVVAAAIRVESTRVAPGVIEHGSPFTALDIAGDITPPERLDELAAVLRDAGAEVRVRDDEATTLWAKLSMLAPAALLTTVYAQPVGVVREERPEETRALLAEVVAVAHAEGARVDESAAVKGFYAFPHATKSSMQRDAEARRPLELDAIGGAVLRAARRWGVAVPVASRLVAELGQRG